MHHTDLPQPTANSSRRLHAIFLLVVGLLVFSSCGFQVTVEEGEGGTDEPTVVTFGFGDDPGGTLVIDIDDDDDVDITINGEIDADTKRGFDGADTTEPSADRGGDD